MDTPRFEETVVVTGSAPSGPQSFMDLVAIFLDLINTAIPVVAGLAFLVFVWGLARFISKVEGDEKAVTEGKNLMKWGLIALFIMVSVWSIISFMQREIGIGSSSGLPLPLLPPQNQQ